MARTGIVNGQRGISADTALRLAHRFGSSAAFRLDLQQIYDLRLAGKRAGRAIVKLPRRPGRAAAE